MKPSTLNSQQTSYKVDKITEAIFAAEAIQDRFAEVNILTLKTHLINVAFEESNNYGYDLLIDNNRIFEQVDEKLKNDKLKDFVEITKDEIRVVIDCELITDDVIVRAFKMLSCVETFTPGTKIEFSKGSQIYESSSFFSQRTH